MRNGSDTNRTGDPIDHALRTSTLPLVGSKRTEPFARAARQACVNMQCMDCRHLFKDKDLRATGSVAQLVGTPTRSPLLGIPLQGDHVLGGRGLRELQEAAVPERLLAEAGLDLPHLVLEAGQVGHQAPGLHVGDDRPEQREGGGLAPWAGRETSGSPLADPSLSSITLRSTR